MRYFVRGWVVASTFYTIFDAIRRLCELHPEKTTVITVLGIVLNLALNGIVLDYFSGDDR